MGMLYCVLKHILVAPRRLATTAAVDTAVASTMKISETLHCPCMHVRDSHQNNFSLSIFNVSVVRKVFPQRIRGEEFKFIDKYRTASLGLNIYKS